MNIPEGGFEFEGLEMERSARWDIDAAQLKPHGWFSC